ncbi:MAG: hypothetical protein WBA74_13325 [Cyclobacteriaceae bacterium]
MFETISSNIFLWQSAYIASLALLGYIMYEIFIKRPRQRMQHGGEVLFLIKKQKNGKFEWGLLTGEQVTKKEAEEIINELIKKMIKRDPALVKLLFVISLDALRKDDDVSSIFRDDIIDH